LTAQQANILLSCERAALMAARLVIVTSKATARTLIADYAVAADRIVVARPGNDARPPAQASTDGIVRLLSVGAIVPRKGFDVLIAALATLADLPWRLTVAGDRGRDAQAAARLNADIARHRLGERVEVLGAVAPKKLDQLYAEADLFVLASRFEGYGMAYSEATAHGVPVVGTNAGAIPDTVPAGAGVLVAPDDAGELARVLRRLIENPAERRSLADGARKAAVQLPAWPDTAAIVARALEGLA
jgi:glycosyltransferase involved in cell wall biosynthesis